MNNPVKFISNFKLPKTLKEVNEVSNLLKGTPKKVKCLHKPNCFENDCHNNVNKYIHMYGGELITGFYLLINSDDGNWVAIRHSIWKNPFGNIIDITKFKDERSYNIFIKTDDYLNYTAIEKNKEGIMIFH